MEAILKIQSLVDTANINNFRLINSPVTGNQLKHRYAQAETVLRFHNALEFSPLPYSALQSHQF
jgi:hypothetical protein